MKQKQKMFSLNSIPRKYIVGACAALALILLVVTLVQPANFGYKDTTNYSAAFQKAEADRQAYEKLLATVDVNPKDSETMLKKIATEDIVKQQVTGALDINQKITIPDVPNSQLAISPRGGKQAVVDYMATTGTAVKQYNDQIALANQMAFTPLQDASVMAQAAHQTQLLVDQLKKTPVPQEALSYHKAQIVTYQQYADFFKLARAYDPTLTPQNDPIRGESNQTWSQAYSDYVVINSQAGVVKNEFNRFDQKYALKDLPLAKYAQVQPADDSGFHVINQAHAFLGFGDMTITIGDIPQLILYGVQQGLAQFFTSFMLKATDSLVTKLNKYFTITSQLYYSQELGKLYTNEYWTKFNVPALDQNIMKNFLPDYFCAGQNTSQLLSVFQAKSKQLLNYDITTLKTSDPNFYLGLAELGTRAQTDSVGYWQDFYQASAQQTQAAAAAAATLEQTSPTNKKSARDLLSQQIQTTSNSIFGVESASLKEVFDLGNSKADSIVANLVTSVFSTITQKFLFTAASSASPGGGVGVLQESNTCLGTAKIQPIIPNSTSAQDAQAATQAHIDACTQINDLVNGSAPTTAQGTGSPVGGLPPTCTDVVHTDTGHEATPTSP